MYDATGNPGIFVRNLMLDSMGARWNERGEPTVSSPSLVLVVIFRDGLRQ